VTSYLGKTGWHGNSGRAFKAERYTSEGEKRHHGGIDLWANDGDAVVAPEAGRILAALPYHHGTWAIYLITHDRRVINLGEVKKYSWREFKVSPGDIVSGGQPLARVGLQAGGNTMLHLETYDGSQNTDEELVDMIRKSELRWYADQAPPAILFDPSAYLLITGARTYAEENSAEIVG
jgi:murein DD-endopeptidase MepM/ murein hydrolase activator NlpD